MESNSSNDKDNSLINYLKEDIDNILIGIKEKYDILNLKLSEIRKKNSEFILNYEYFLDLLEEFCYRVRSYTEKEEIDINLKTRLKFFDQIFFNKIEKFDYAVLHFYQYSSSFNRSALYFRLLYSIFCSNIKTNENINSLYFELYKEWLDATQNKKMMISIFLPLPMIRFSENSGLKGKNSYIINENISMNWYLEYDFFGKSGLKDFNQFRSLSYISINMVIPFEFYSTLDDRNEKFIKNKELFRKNSAKMFAHTREIVCSFYIKGIEFEYKQYFLNLPWWFQPKDDDEYDIFDSISLKEIELNKNILDKISNIYLQVVKSKIFLSEKTLILWNHYVKLFNSDLIPDLIINAFIVFEYIFAQESRYEVNFRLAFNIGLFLAKDFKNFEDIRKFIKDMYGLRSSIVHGSKWQKGIRKILRDYPEFSKYIDIIQKLKFYLNKSIEKLLYISDMNPDAMNKLTSTFFLKNSEFLAIKQ